MIKQAPSRGRIALMVVFALSCFVLLTYLWTTFGGPVPLRPQGYRFQADFEEATQLADNAQVRISGVPVGKVIRSRLEGNRTRVTIEMQSRYSPVPRDTRATLRQKTLLGETYIELSPGNRGVGPLPDGGRLPQTNVRPTVELDEVLRGLDAPTRRDLQRFLLSLSHALDGRGEDLSDALGNAAPFTTDATDLLRTLDSQRAAVRRLVSDTGLVFESIGRRQGQLQGLVVAGDRLLATTARRNRDLAETVRILPTTLRELRPTLAQIETFSTEARPLVSALRPAGRALAPTLADVSALSPELEGLFRALGPVITASEDGLPALTRTVAAARPVMGRLEPVLREALPVVDYLGLFKQELVSTTANVAAATQAGQPTRPGGKPLEYLRALVPFTFEGMVARSQRLGSNRHNPYFAPRALDKLLTGLESFDCRNASSPEQPQPAPACKEQAPLDFRGKRRLFTHVEADR
jgi:virulence factor Mce-like protein